MIEYEKGLYVPNAIAPNEIEYGLKKFNAVATGLLEYHIMVFDTYGNIVWESNLINDKGEPIGGWDGTLNGMYLPQDVYVWTIIAKFKDGSIWPYENNIKRTGTVTIIR